MKKDKNNKYKIEFPNGFFGFHDGVPISHEEINEQVKEIIESFEREEIEGGYIYWATGNTFIMVEELVDYYEVYISQGYFTKLIKKKGGKKWKKN